MRDSTSGTVLHSIHLDAANFGELNVPSTTRTMLKTKSVYSPIDHAADGLRILATRNRGRGMKKTRYHVWMANFGPSESLLGLFRSGTISWGEFARRYKAEMRTSPVMDRKNSTIKNHGQKFTFRLLQKLATRGHVTLMCHCAEDQRHCHRFLLQRLIEAV